MLIAIQLFSIVAHTQLGYKLQEKRKDNIKKKPPQTNNVVNNIEYVGCWDNEEKANEKM